MTPDEEAILRQFLDWLDANTLEAMGYVPLGSNDDLIARFRAWHAHVVQQAREGTLHRGERL